MAIMRSQVRIQALIWIMVLSIGYFGVKGGGFTIVNGGAYTVLGPPESIIEDRNHLALACCMIIPLMNYLRVTTANRLIKIGLMLAMALTIISVIGSYSRGGFLALSVTAFVFWLRSSGKLMTMVLLLACFIPAVSLMPDTLEGADQLDRELPEGRFGPGAVRRLELRDAGGEGPAAAGGRAGDDRGAAPSSINTFRAGRSGRRTASISRCWATRDRSG